jgi:hypothetical protein
VPGRRGYVYTRPLKKFLLGFYRRALAAAGVHGVHGEVEGAEQSRAEHNS